MIVCETLPENANFPAGLAKLNWVMASSLYRILKARGSYTFENDPHRMAYAGRYVIPVVVADLKAINRP